MKDDEYASLCDVPNAPGRVLLSGSRKYPIKRCGFWIFLGKFFKLGGYDKITPYAIDAKPINIWYTNTAGEDIYFHGLIVKDVDKIPEGYSLVKFPACDFIVVTYEWVTKQEFNMGVEIDNGWKYIETVSIPEGYEKWEGQGSPFNVIEKDNQDTPDGSRYEFWVPIKKM